MSSSTTGPPDVAKRWGWILADGILGVIVGVLSSAVSLYYDLRVVVYMYMRPEPTGAEPPRFGFNAGLVVVACAAFTLAHLAKIEVAVLGDGRFASVHRDQSTSSSRRRGGRRRPRDGRESGAL